MTQGCDRPKEPDQSEPDEFRLSRYEDQAMEALCDTVLEIYGIDLDNEVAYEAVRRAEITAASGKVGGWCSWRCKTTIPAIPDIEDPITFEFRVDESPEVLSYNDD